MALTETAICNLALGHLGEGPISSINDDTTAARACLLHFEPCRDATLRAHRWNFAVERVKLDDATAPAFGWDYQFDLPSDCLRVLEVNGSEEGDLISEPWVVEGRKLLTDAYSANVVYVKQITDVTLFDPLFVEAFALRLAVALSEVIRGTTDKTGELLTAYERVTAPLARRIDANEGRRRKGMIDLNSQAIRARFEGV